MVYAREQIEAARQTVLRQWGHIPDHRAADLVTMILAALDALEREQAGAAHGAIRDLLKRLEWAGRLISGHSCCALCRRVETHAPDCVLAAVLKEKP